MTKVKINRAELLVTSQGLDNNGNYKIGAFDTDDSLEETELCPKSILKIAKEYFGGRSFPLESGKTTYIGHNSKVLTVEWESDYSYNPNESRTVYGVFYRGTYIGEIEIIRG